MMPIKASIKSAAVPAILFNSHKQTLTANRITSAYRMLIANNLSYSNRPKNLTIRMLLLIFVIRLSSSLTVRVGSVITPS